MRMLILHVRGLLLYHFVQVKIYVYTQDHP